jgi:hypothetical protein
MPNPSEKDLKRTHREMCDELNMMLLVRQGYTHLNIIERLPLTGEGYYNCIAKPIREDEQQEDSIPLEMEAVCGDIDYWVEQKYFGVGYDLE